MLSILFPSMGARLNRDGKPSAAYFYRSKYLLAPDPSTLAQPGRFVARKDHHTEPTHWPNCPPSEAFSGRRDLGSSNIATFPRVRGTWKLVASGTLPTSPGECNVFFPPPPTLADIQRMEPDLSPAAALMRAGDHPGPNMPDSIDAGGMSATDTQMGSLNLPEAFAAAANEPPQPFRIVVENSPIVHEQRISQVSGVQCISAVPSSGSVQLEEGPLFDDATIDQAAQSTRQGTTSPSPSAPEKSINPGRITFQPEFTQEDKMNFKALAGWLAEYLQAVASEDNASSSRSVDFTLCYAADRIYSILRGALPSVSTVFLALWYIGRLPLGFVNSDVFEQYIGRDSLLVDEIIVRTLVVGLILANKWLEDCNFSAKCWHRISSLPLSLINRLEVFALVALNYNLCITSGEWNRWLMDLRAYQSSLARFQPISRNLGASYVLIRELMDETLSAIRVHQAYSRGGGGPVRVFAVRDYIGGKRKRSLSPEYKSDGRTCLAFAPRLCAQESPIDLPLPAPWLPEADPIVFKAARTIGIAPGMERVQKSFTAITTYAADNIHSPQAMTCVVDMLTCRKEK